MDLTLNVLLFTLGNLINIIYHSKYEIKSDIVWKEQKLMMN